MRMRCLAALIVMSCFALPLFAQNDILGYYARDPQQPIDQQYTQQIKKYTTEPYFNSPLTDYLPASKTVPTPEAVLGDVSGAPNMLPYAETVYKYFRLLVEQRLVGNRHGNHLAAFFRVANGVDAHPRRALGQQPEILVHRLRIGQHVGRAAHIAKHGFRGGHRLRRRQIVR